MSQPEQLKHKETERPPEKVEEIKKLPETLEELSNHGKKTIEKVKKTSREVINFGVKQIKEAVTSIDGGPEDIKAGETAIAPTQEQISNLAKNTQKEIRKTAEIKARVGLKDTYTPEQLNELRTKTKDDYGEGLVSKFHKGAETLADHERAQWEAYKALDKKIEAGVVKPDSITSDMLNRLELRNKPEVVIESVEQIAEQIASELKELTKKGFIKEDEARLIQVEAEKFAEIYKKAFPNADLQQVFEVTRDNARKLAYQTERDKQVFSGSDHGTKHILEGNMKMADRMIESLGDKVSVKDKILIRQIIIDHDLGYTVGVAQAKESFAASKDHPLFSAKFVEANKEYYKQMFGEDGYEMILEGILQHSYPKSEYGTPTDPEKGFNPDIIRSITSTVDALGVTAETKCPAFFRRPDVIKVLQKVKLYADTHEGKVDQEVLKMYKNQLRAIADKEPDAVRREGFYNAIENQFNPVTVEMTLGQYVGVLKDIKMTEREGKIVPHISMEISRTQALLGDLFGDKISTQAFVKAMEDFGVSRDVMAKMAEVIRHIREAKTDEEKTTLKKKLTYSSDKAVFEFVPEFAEITPEIEKTFEELERLSIRNEIRNLSRRLESPETQIPENVEAFLLEFNTAISEKVDEEDLNKINEFQNKIRSAVGNPEAMKKALVEFNTFTTKREKEFMGI